MVVDGKMTPNERMSFAVTAKMKRELETIAAKRNMSVSHLIRDYIEKGMNVDKTRQDIDFIRKQIREELEIVLKPQVNRLAKLHMRVGIMSTALCYFTSKVIYHFVPFPDRTTYEELIQESRHDAAAYLNVRDAGLDAAFKEFDENNP